LITKLETILSRFSNDNDFLYFIVILDDTDFIQVKNLNIIYIKYDGSNFDSIIDTIKRKMIKYNLQQQLSDDYIDIAIKSKGIPDEVKWQENYNWSIMLKNFFEGNYLAKLRDDYSWNDVIHYFKAEYSFIKGLLNNSKKVRFFLNCHFTFAFLAGKLTGEIGRFNKNIILRKPDGTDLDLYDDSATGEYEEFSYELTGKSSEESENILIISIKRDIKPDVIRYISNTSIKQGLVLHVKMDGNIEDGIHTKRLILSLKQYIETNRINKSAKMHVFYNGPAFFMFMIGNHSQFMGKMQIYEYLLEDNNYYPILSMMSQKDTFSHEEKAPEKVLEEVLEEESPEEKAPEEVPEEVLEEESPEEKAFRAGQDAFQEGIKLYDKLLLNNAKDRFIQAISYAVNRPKDDRLKKYLIETGNVYFVLGEYSKAKEYFTVGFQAFDEDINFEVFIAYCDLEIIKVDCEPNDGIKKEISNLINKLENRLTDDISFDQKCSIHFWLGHAYYKIKEYLFAKDHFKEAKEHKAGICIKRNDNLWIFRSLLKLDIFDEAIDEYKRAKAYKREDISEDTPQAREKKSVEEMFIQFEIVDLLYQEQEYELVIKLFENKIKPSDPFKDYLKSPHSYSNYEQHNKIVLRIGISYFNLKKYRNGFNYINFSLLKAYEKEDKEKEDREKEDNEKEEYGKELDNNLYEKEIYSSFRNIEKSIYKLKDSLEFKEDKEITHYTTLKNLNYMIKTPIRISNASYVNDPGEGTVLLEYVKHHLSNKGKNKKGSSLWEHIFSICLDKDRQEINFNRVFTLSFIKTQSNGNTCEGKKDKLKMWTRYGDNGQGCCIVLKDLRKLTDNCLYKIIYIDDNQKIEDDDPSIENQLDKLIDKISNYLSSLESKLKDDNEDCHTECCSLLIDLLDEVRFLFKSTDYKDEEEVRIIQCFEEGHPSIKSGSYDPENVDKIYVELDKDLIFEEVILGPKVQNPEGVAAYLYHSGKVKKVTKSKIKYR
jgi:hypothetical protein